MCDICQVDGILSKYMGSETARVMPIERIEEGFLVGYRIAFGGYWMGNACAETFEAAMPKVDEWAFGFSKQILAHTLDAEETEEGLKGSIGPVQFQMTHDGNCWVYQINNRRHTLKGLRINEWVEEVKASLAATVVYN